jgi:hypothetical protein
VDAADAPKVIVALMDGLDPEAISPELTPALWALRTDPAARTTVIADGRAVMPSVTNTNHASILTGAYAEAHGITGNYCWKRGSASPRDSLDRPDQLEAQTIFTLAERRRPELVTALVAGKAKIARLFGAGGSQRPPDHVWSDAELTDEPKNGRFGSDPRTIEQALHVVGRSDPDFLFVSLSEVDLLSHAFGPESLEVRRGVLEADRAIGRLVRLLVSTGRWSRTVLIVTADHSFRSLVRGRENTVPPVFLTRELARAGLGEDVVAVSDGAFGHLYLRGLDPSAESLSAEQRERLRAAAAMAAGLPDVEEVVSRVPGIGAPTLAEAHPEWRLDHSRAGELLVVARPGHHFVDPFRARAVSLLGQHGSPAEQPIPILVTGGYPLLRGHDQSTRAGADNADLGATVLTLLGLGEPRFVSGEPIPRHLAGRMLSEIFLEQRLR